MSRIEKDKTQVMHEVQKWIHQVLKQKRLVLTEEERHSTMISYLPESDDWGNKEMVVLITAGTKVLGKRRWKYQWHDPNLPWTH